MFWGLGGLGVGVLGVKVLVRDRLGVIAPPWRPPRRTPYHVAGFCRACLLAAP